MKPRAPFNYLITVHNKESLLQRVLAGVDECAGKDSRIVVVLDGCTDNSETIAREFANSTSRECRLVTASDVHEIKSINIGLGSTKPGYCVILQDDVILNEPDLERMVDDLCEAKGRRLGYISFRFAADVRGESMHDRLRRLRYRPETILRYPGPLVLDYNHISSPHEHMDFEKLPYGEFAERMVGIKSPVCLTPELRAVEPFVDEAFAPYCYDDVDLSLRALKAGLVNGLFAIHFQCELEWGGTRKDPDFSGRVGGGIRLRNQSLIWKKHGAFIRAFSRRAASGHP
jgi:glycosyltransferase involved in cell wall biosynthesis